METVDGSLGDDDERGFMEEFMNGFVEGINEGGFINGFVADGSMDGFANGFVADGSMDGFANGFVADGSMAAEFVDSFIDKFINDFFSSSGFAAPKLPEKGKPFGSVKPPWNGRRTPPSTFPWFSDSGAANTFPSPAGIRSHTTESPREIPSFDSGNPRGNSALRFHSLLFPAGIHNPALEPIGETGETEKPETASIAPGTSETEETGVTGVTGETEVTDGMGEIGVTGETEVTEVPGVSRIPSIEFFETPIPAVFASSSGKKSAGTLSALRMWEKSGSGAGAWATAKGRTRLTAGIGGGSSAQAPRITSSREKPLFLKNRGESPTSVWPG